MYAKEVTVVPGVLRHHKFLSPTIISSCLPACRLGTGQGWQGSRDIGSSCLPSCCPLVSLPVAWEPNGGAGLLGVLVSILLTWEPDRSAGGPGKTPVFASHDNVLLSPSLSLGGDWWCRGAVLLSPFCSLGTGWCCRGPSSSCLLSCSLGTGWWCRGAWEIASLCLTL